jgi:hypothetical protein
MGNVSSKIPAGSVFRSFNFTTGLKLFSVTFLAGAVFALASCGAAGVLESPLTEWRDRPVRF